MADPDLEIREGGSLVIQTLGQGGDGLPPKKIFSSLRALVWSKIKRGTGPPGPLPGSTTEHYQIMMLEPLIRRCWMSLDKVG